MAIQEPVGERFYIFREGDQRAEHLIIYSHGGYYPWTSRFRVPAETTLYFYGPDRRALTETNSNITRVVAGARHYEVAGSGDRVRNYSLGKFYLQTREPHRRKMPPGRLTYALILEAIDAVRTQIAHQKQHAADIPPGMEVIPRMDVLTVRHRRMRLSVGLHDAVRAAENLGYRRLHCYFCRSPMIDTESAPTHWLDSNVLEFPH